jgi:hypothetical protein
MGSSREPGGTQIWVTYRTPNLRAQRFYTVKPLQLDLVPNSETLRSGGDVALLNSAIMADHTRLQGPNVQDIPPMHAILDYVGFKTASYQIITD